VETGFTDAELSAEAEQSTLCLSVSAWQCAYIIPCVHSTWLPCNWLKRQSHAPRVTARVSQRVSPGCCCCCCCCCSRITVTRLYKSQHSSRPRPGPKFTHNLRAIL